MMKVHFVLVLISCLLAGCIKEQSVEEVKLSDSLRLQAYIEEHLNVDTFDMGGEKEPITYHLTNDSLWIGRLNTTLYNVRSPNVIDDPDYVLALDHGTGNIHHWTMGGRWFLGSPVFDYYPQDQHEFVLDHPHVSFNIPALQGLEFFLNHCQALNKEPLEVATLDSVFTFSKPYTQRLTDLSAIDSLTDKLRIREVLKAKMDKEFALVYKSGLVVSYFDHWYNGGNLSRSEKIKEIRKTYPSRVKGSLYRIKVVRINKAFE
jgi:hypothetical protein